MSIAFSDNEKSRERIGLYRLYSFIVILSVGIISGYGFGYKILYNVAAITSLAGLCGITLIDDTKFFKSLSCWVLIGSVIILSIFDVSILQCTSLIALILYVCRHENSGVALLASQLYWTLTGFIRIDGSEVLLSPVVAIMTYTSSLIALRMMYQKWHKWFNLMIFSLYALSLIHHSSKGFLLDKCVDDSVPYGYRIGTALETVIGKQLPTAGCLYYANEADTIITNVGTVYLDHDSKTVYDAGQFEQRSPWSWNELIAAEPYRVATTKDGCLILNRGSHLRSNSTNPLWGLSDGFSFHTLCGFEGDRLILGDSDMVGNLLAPYQHFLIRRLAGVDVYYQMWNIAISFLLIMLPLGGVVTLKRILGIGLVVSYYFIFPKQTITGGVRYVGERILYPHTSLGYGVVRGLQRDGFNCLFTDKEASILVVGEGMSANYENEKYVLLEPGARVDVHGEISIRAGNVPQGNSGIIPDARLLYKDDGTVVGNGVYKNHEIVYIASGALASIDFKALLCK